MCECGHMALEHDYLGEGFSVCYGITDMKYLCDCPVLVEKKESK